MKPKRRKILLICAVFIFIYLFWFALLCEHGDNGEKTEYRTVYYRWAYVLFQPVFRLEKVIYNLSGHKYIFECVRGRIVVRQGGDVSGK